MKQIGVIGTGTWGTALAVHLAQQGHAVTVWSPFVEELEALSATHTHPHLPYTHIPESIVTESDLGVACTDKDLLVFAVPSVFVRETALRAKPYIPAGQLIVDVAKGIEEGTLLTMTEILAEVLGPSVRTVALSGPTHAEEVAVNIPTAIVSASADTAAAKEVQDIFMSPTFRVYVNDDAHGVELSGALKNVVALAAGISAGLGYGDNTIAAIISRGIAEISRLGMAMGCRPETFYGLAGIGDLVVTCYSRHSRNHQAGTLIGQGVPPKEALQRVGMVVEGVNTLPAAVQLAEKYGVELPIIFAVRDVFEGTLTAREAVTELMCRQKRTEF